MLLWCCKGDILSHFDVKIIQLKLNWKEILMDKCVNAVFSLSLLCWEAGCWVGEKQNMFPKETDIRKWYGWPKDSSCRSSLFWWLFNKRLVRWSAKHIGQFIYHILCVELGSIISIFFSLCISSINIFVFFPISLCIA